jgi:hypothetical protein
MVYFQTKNPNLGKNLEGLGMENVVIFYDHLEYFLVIWYNLWLFGIVCGHLVHFSHFGMFGPRKIWQPCSFFVPSRAYLEEFVEHANIFPNSRLEPQRYRELGGLNHKKSRCLWLERVT